MSSAPLQIDQLQIAPGSTGMRAIRRNEATGGLQFADPVAGAHDLSQLAGLRNVAGVLVVGRDGSGAQHRTIQAALAAIPAGSSAATPWVVLVCPGTYAETINIVRDGVEVVGLGGVTITSAAESDPDGTGAYHTVVIQADQGTVPRHVVLRNLTVANAHRDFACVRVVGGAGSQVGASGVILRDCDLRAAGRPVWATSVNVVRVLGGSWAGSASTAQCLASNCAGLDVDGVRGVGAIECNYTLAGVLPATTGSAYRIANCPAVGAGSALSPAVAATLSGAGSLEIVGCAGMGAVTVAGDRSLLVVGSSIGDLALGGTVAATLVGSSRGLATGLAATLAEPLQRGAASLVGDASKAVTFPVPHPDDKYVVQFELAGQPVGVGPWITNRTATGFTLNFAQAQTLSVQWVAARSAA